MNVYGHTTSQGVGALTEAALEWAESDPRFADVNIRDVIVVLREAMNGAATLTVMGPRKGDIQFGRGELIDPWGRQTHRTLTIEELVERAQAMTPTKRDT